MRGWIRRVGGVVGVPSLLLLALLAGCGGGDGDTEGTQSQSTGGSGGAGGSGGGTSGSAGSQSGGSAGTSTAGTGGTGQAGEAGSGQAGEAGTGQAGEAGAGQAGEAGSGQAGEAGSGQAGEAGSGGDAGTGQAGDGGAAGTGGSGQAGSGQAGSGQAGEAGSGQGGSPGACCKEDKDCVGEDPVVLVCAGGQCKLPAAKGECWQDADCGSGFTCEGEFVCPCGALCGPLGDTTGKCVPLGPSCCKADAECTKQGLDQCVEGTCREKLASGQCWDTSDCGPGQVCQNAAPCPCGLLCDQDSPGKCASAVDSCCKEDKDCGAGGDCVGTVCKKPAPAGQCWEDDDCAAGSTCEGEIVCPCGALCLLPDTPGKCTPGGGGNLCCKSDDDCKKQGLDQCAGDVCVKKVPAVGQCWEDTDCKPGQTCEGEQLCPCGAACLLPNAPGKCQDGSSTPPACCKEDKSCGDKNQCVLPLGGGIGSNSEGVCKPLLTDGTCWDNGDCKPGMTCKGQQVCPCNADCFVPDSPGKCL